MTLAAYLHTLSPFAIRFTEGFGIRWYGLSYLTGFVVGYLLLRWLAARRLVLIPVERVGDSLMWIVGGVLVGGRLGYVAFYDRPLAWTVLDHMPWWGLLAINDGGMSSHGGMIGVLLAALRIARGWRDEQGRVYGAVERLHAMDALVAIAPPGLAFGRLANFVNGELLGRIVTPPGVEGPWWAVQFPQELKSGHAPELTVEQADQLKMLVAQAAPGESYERGVQALIGNAGKYAAQLKPLLASRHPSQLYQAVAEGVLVGVVLWLVWARPRKPGLVTAWASMVYGALRIVTEIWRLPDPGLERIWGLSRGQWLSVAMIVFGLALLAVVVRRPAEKLGGWAVRRGAGTEGAASA